MRFAIGRLWYGSWPLSRLLLPFLLLRVKFPPLFTSSLSLPLYVSVHFGGLGRPFHRDSSAQISPEFQIGRRRELVGALFFDFFLSVLWI